MKKLSISLFNYFDSRPDPFYIKKTLIKVFHKAMWITLKIPHKYLSINEINKFKNTDFIHNYQLLSRIIVDNLKISLKKNSPGVLRTPGLFVQYNLLKLL